MQICWSERTLRQRPELRSIGKGQERRRDALSALSSFLGLYEKAERLSCAGKRETFSLSNLAP